MKNKYIILIVIVFMVVVLPVSAHPGKTDKYGGHYDNETGEYHYHHGYPAHEHIDGVCQYDFDDKTGQNSGSLTSSVATKKPDYHIETPDPLSPVMADITPTPSSATVEPTASSTQNQNNVINWAWFLIPCTAFAGGIGYFAKSKRKKSNAIIVIDEPPALPPSEPEPIMPPEGYSLDENGLPYKNNCEYGWGKEFNVFVTKYGKCYHRSRCNALTPANKRLVHRYTAIKNGYKPCPYCKPKKHIDDWYKQ